MKPAQRHVTVVLGTIALFMVATALINTWVNPFRVMPAPWSEDDFEPYRDIQSQIRTGKAGLIRANQDIDVAFTGSSRVENALNPENPNWENQTVMNLGCSGGLLYESSSIAHYLIDHRNPSLLICGIDPGDITRDVDTRPKSDFYNSPFSSTNQRVDREMRYLFGISTMESALETIERRRKQQPSAYTPKGLRHARLGTRTGRQIDFIKARFTASAFIGGDPVEDAAPRPEKLKLLRELMTEARSLGIRIILYIHPQHVAMLARARDKEQAPLFFAQEKPALVALVEEVNQLDLPGPPIDLWDFFDFHPINCEPIPTDGSREMTYWDDLGHYSIAVGDAMLARMMGWDIPIEGAEDYGTPLSSDNLAERLQKIRQDYRAYLSGLGAADIAWKEQLIEQQQRKN